MSTAASSRSISTQHFGKEFDSDKVEAGPLEYSVYVFPPENAKDNPNITLHYEIEKFSLEDLSSGNDMLELQYMNIESTYRRFNYTPPDQAYSFPMTLKRHVIPADVKKQKLRLMPGFRFTWYYSGVEVKSWDKYANGDDERVSTKAFIRDGSIENND